mmetsp:Transcript_30224/g.86356  ORF Transcript_30224/g.86356 Transcript_30224/m.86356 type:complete len:408 (-) Transcript_30224:50-1273(-)
MLVLPLHARQLLGLEAVPLLLLPRVGAPPVEQILEPAALQATLSHGQALVGQPVPVLKPLVRLLLPQAPDEAGGLLQALPPVVLRVLRDHPLLLGTAQRGRRVAALPVFEGRLAGDLGALRRAEDDAADEHVLAHRGDVRAGGLDVPCRPECRHHGAIHPREHVAHGRHVRRGVREGRADVLLLEKGVRCQVVQLEEYHEQEHKQEGHRDESARPLHELVLVDDAHEDADVDARGLDVIVHLPLGVLQQLRQHRRRDGPFEALLARQEMFLLVILVAVAIHGGPRAEPPATARVALVVHVRHMVQPHRPRGHRHQARLALLPVRRRRVSELRAVKARPRPRELFAAQPRLLPGPAVPDDGIGAPELVRGGDLGPRGRARIHQDAHVRHGRPSAPQGATPSAGRGALA